MTPLAISEREGRRIRRRWAARGALFVDMLKSYAAPLILAAYIVPALNQGGEHPLHLGAANYVLLIVGLAMIGLALILVDERT